MKDIWSFVRPYKTKFFLGTFLRAFGDILWLFPPWALAEIITFASEHKNGEPILYVWHLFFLLAIVSVLHFVCFQWAKYFVYQVAENTNIDVQNTTIKHLHAVDLDWHEKETSGSKIQRIWKAGQSMNTIIRVYIDLIIESTINLVVILCILSTFYLSISLFLLLFFLSYYFLSRFLVRKAVQQSHAVNIEWENYSGIAFESINNISTIKSLRVSDGIFPFLTTISGTLSRKIRKRIFYYRTRGAILGMYQDMFRLGVLSFVVWLVVQGKLEVGVIALVLLYFGKIEASASEFSESYSEFATAKIAILRMKEVLNIPPIVENSGTKSFPVHWKKLIFQDVGFSYRGKKVLNHFSLEIPRGKKVGIVGISGAGKSTLFKLLLKLYHPSEGRIIFDNVPLENIKRSSYMKNVSVVPQETELFHLSLEKNITISESQKDTERFQKALRIAHVEDFLHKLPDGIHSLVGEKGIRLSGGEKQRVGIARAIYRNPEILLLDEATSHLDVESEKKIQEALHSFFQNITAIVIAHRLSTIREMDSIVVIENGSVLEQGTFDELLRKKGKFAYLWERQQF